MATNSLSHISKKGSSFGIASYLILNGFLKAFFLTYKQCYTEWVSEMLYDYLCHEKVE